MRLDAPICLDDPSIRERPKVLQAPAAEASRSLFARQWQAPWLKLGLFMLLCAAPLGGSLLLLQQQGLAWPLLAYALASVLALLLYGLDKRSALRGARRTPENSLHLVEALGGWPGALLAQQLFRHKTRKLAYQLVLGHRAAASAVLDRSPAAGSDPAAGAAHSAPAGLAGQGGAGVAQTITPWLRR